MRCRKPKVIPAPRKHSRAIAALHLVREDGRVNLFISVANGHTNPCGSPGKDWKYCSPKSVLLESEQKRGITVAHIIEKADDMLGIPIVDEIFGQPVDWKVKKA